MYCKMLNEHFSKPQQTIVKLDTTVWYYLCFHSIEKSLDCLVKCLVHCLMWYSVGKLLTQEMEGVEEREDQEQQQALLTSKEMSSTMVNREVMKVRREQAAIVGQSRV